MEGRIPSEEEGFKWLQAYGRGEAKAPTPEELAEIESTLAEAAKNKETPAIPEDEVDHSFDKLPKRESNEWWHN